MLGGIEGNSFVLMEFEDAGGVFEFALLAFAALGLDGAKLFEGLLELTPFPSPPDCYPYGEVTFP